jgi:hypothetical protein
MSDNNVPGWAQYAFLFIFALIFSLAGLFILLAAFDVIALDPASIHAPRWVLAAAGLIFLLGGFMIILRGTEGDGNKDLFHEWAEYFVIAGMMIAFSAVFLWVGFGPGERQFQTETSFGPVAAYGEGDALTGRCLFGMFGLATLLGTLYYIVSRPLVMAGLWTPPKLLRGRRIQAGNHEEHEDANPDD